MQRTAIFMQVPQGYIALVEELPGPNTQLARRDAELDANLGIALTWEQIRASFEAKP